MARRSTGAEAGSHPGDYAEALLRVSLGVSTRADVHAGAGSAEWFAAGVVVVAVMSLCSRTGDLAGGTLLITGALPLVAAFVRSALHRQQLARGTTARAKAFARFARGITPLLLLAFPVSLAIGWFTREVPFARGLDLHLGSISYVLALLELVQLRLWSALGSGRAGGDSMSELG